MKALTLTETGYWTATVLAALLFAVPGVGLVAGVPYFVNNMADLGYPAYFSGFLGASKLLGAAALLVPGYPRLKEWAYAGLMFDVIGAVASRAAMGNEAVAFVVPVGIGIVLALSYVLRPAGRRLTAIAG